VRSNGWSWRFEESLTESLLAQEALETLKGLGTSDNDQGFLEEAPMAGKITYYVGPSLVTEEASRICWRTVGFPLAAPYLHPQVKLHPSLQKDMPWFFRIISRVVFASRAVAFLALFWKLLMLRSTI
jgi:hypothetical protein